MTSVALWKPEDLKKHERGIAGSWEWLGREERATRALKRFRARNPNLVLQARLWPSGEAWEPVEASGRIAA